ncbi:MAG: oxygen-dependent coproporphyrinogen oxidase [Bacteriovoracaceae bacterium]
MTTGVKERFAEHVKSLQNQITDEIKRIDESVEIKQDLWKRNDHIGADGGGGITRAFKGKIFENAGVNTSEVYGEMAPEFSRSINASDNNLWATGISLIIHPFNPRVPTVHANFRMIQGGDKIWFGGGADLTPYYPHEEDFEYFHNIWKECITPYGHYDDWKKQCDEYFVNHHRESEMRGVGGFFYDHFNSGDLEKDFKMFTDISSHFIKSYFPLVEKRMNEAYTDEDVDFQLFRRGRYVEFNLLHDRGTTFGLKSGGRTESILISLPARCKFEYGYQPQGVHQKMMEYYTPRQWV